MSLVQEEGKDEVHFPKRRDVFEFDEEVAAIFPSMALRSIPMYAEVHRLHAALLKRMFVGRPMDVLDVGASRGHFLREICNQLQNTEEARWLGCYAMEKSAPMVARIKEEFPHILCVEQDVTTLPDLGQQFDVISMLYVLQFIPNAQKRGVLEWAYAHLRKGGVLILGQKEHTETRSNHHVEHDEYIQFRMDNGYTAEEIEAKTAALRNSMWCVEHDDLYYVLDDIGFYGMHDTSRWLMFSTLMARR